MTVIIESKNEEPLLDKVTILATCSDSQGLKKELISKDLAAQLSLPEESIVVEHIYPCFGLTKIRVHASAYTNVKTKEYFKKKVKKKPVAGENTHG